MCEHTELPAKLLDYFLRSNKSNINQTVSNTLQKHSLNKKILQEHSLKKNILQEHSLQKKYYRNTVSKVSLLYVDYICVSVFL